MPNKAENLRAKIGELVAEYHAAAFALGSFVPGTTPVPVSGRVFDASELQHVVDAGLDFWLTSGRFSEQFERDFAKLNEARAAVLVNSGSSANLLALAALTDPLIGDDYLRPGDEIITVASGFPTTVNPSIQYGLLPVFVDVHIPTYNVDVTQLEAALSSKTKAIMLAHTLGNPFDLKTVSEFAAKHNLWLVEDCCDALGAKFNGKRVGTFGDLATTSFYPAHHITMGEGGCVLTSSPKLKTVVESLRDWGRDCWCATGCDNTCGKRFEWKLGDLPEGYDHKYIYSRIGYNLKLTDLQAAVGLAQLQKLDGFIQKRNDNFQFLHEGLSDLQDGLILPQATAGSTPSWFGFPLAVSAKAKFTRRELILFLDSRKIGTRLIFGGNLVRQPAYRSIKKRIIGDLRNSDFVMNNAFWLGVYPGLTQEMLQYVVDSVRAFVQART